jgi:hypothetical protein
MSAYGRSRFMRTSTSIVDGAGIGALSKSIAAAALV